MPVTYCSGLTPTSSWAPTEFLTRSPHSRIGNRVRRAKAGKFCRLWYSLLSEGGRKKQMWCTITHHLPPADCCQPVSKQQLLWKDSLQVIAECDDSMMSQCGILPWSVWVNSPSCVPPQPLGHPILLTGAGDRARSREGLDTVQHCSAIGETWVCYQHLVTALKHSTIPAATTKVNSIPTRPSTPSKLQTV